MIGLYVATVVIWAAFSLQQGLHLLTVDRIFPYLSSPFRQQLGNGKPIFLDRHFHLQYRCDNLHASAILSVYLRRLVSKISCLHSSVHLQRSR